MHSARACILKHRVRLLSDSGSVLWNSCKCLSSVRSYRIVSCVSPFSTRPTVITRPPAVRSAVQHLQTSYCEVHSHSVTDEELTDQRSVSSENSADDDRLDVEVSNLHTPVLAKEVVDLIAPAKGQVCIRFYSEWFVYDLMSFLAERYFSVFLQTF